VRTTVESPAIAGIRLVDYAQAHLGGVHVRAVGPLIAAGKLLLNTRIGRIDDRVHAGDVLEITECDSLEPWEVALPVAHEDDDLIVVDKPGGIHVHPIGAYRTGTLVNALLWLAGARLGQPWTRWRPHPVHRLDRPTSGLVIFAKHAAAHDAVRRAFDRGEGQRRYRATVVGVVGMNAGTIDTPLGRDPTNDYRRAVVPDGDRAVTHYTVIARDADRTTLELTLETGRTHQIRAHLASIGHPVVGDALYGGGDPRGPGIELRAFELSFAGRHGTYIISS